jgi:HTH-type transcriptional regulator/antitoxin HigA
MRSVQIGSEADYVNALIEIRRLAEAEPDRGSPEGDRIEALAVLIEAHEADGQPYDFEDAQYR